MLLSPAPPPPTPRPTRQVLILGGGPNRIGQGIEFDYCCCHASFSLRDAGYETIMMNSNPETVSTDYDTSSRLYFEPLTVGGWEGGWVGGRWQPVTRLLHSPQLTLAVPAAAHLPTFSPALHLVCPLHTSPCRLRMC